MKFGELELFVVSDGTFRLDGGAMFGTIPKVLWERTNPADDRNQILMGLNCLLIRTPMENILVDTGLGNAYNEKFAFLYGVDKSQTELPRSLAAAGVQAGGYQQSHSNAPTFRSRRLELLSSRRLSERRGG